MIRILFAALILLTLCTSSLFSQDEIEICNNAIDDDDNGLNGYPDPPCKFCYFVKYSTLDDDFESYNCCPEFPTETECINGWQSMSGSPDYFNTCDFIGGVFVPEVPLPLPSGDGAVGFSSLNETIGTCTQDNILLNGETYDISFDVGFNTGINFESNLNVELSLYGTYSCLFTPPDYLGNCATWTEIATFSMTGTENNSWIAYSSSFSPEYPIYAVAIGHSCDFIGNNPDANYHFIDQIKLSGNFGTLLSEIPGIAYTGDCINGVFLDADIDNGGDYQWFLGGEPIPGATTNPYQMDPIQSGVYSVSILDDLGCNLVSDPLLIIIDFDVLNIQSIVIDLSCSSLTDGSIELTVDSPNTPYTFNWNNGETTSFIENLIAGSYTVTVTDSNGCFTVQTYTIELPEAIIALVTGDCISGVEIYVDIDIPGATFQWYLDGVLIPGAISNPYIIPSDAQGEYHVIVSANGLECLESIPILVEIDLEVLEVEATIIVPSCATASNGSIELSIDSPNMPYTIIWDNGETTSTIENLNIGSYSVTVTDANGCFTTETYVLNALDFDLDINGDIIDVLCYGLSTGSINVTADQSNPPLSFLWSNGETSADIQNLAAGTYTITVTDANGCFNEKDFTVESPDPFFNTIIVVQANMGTPGSASITSTGGLLQYTYQWSTGNTTNSDNNLSAGSYSVTVSDENGCQEIFEFEITTDFIVNSSSTDVSCFGSCDGSISLTVDGPDVVYSVTWDDLGLEGFMPLNVCAGTYNYLVTDENGLTFGGTVIITQPDEIIIFANYQEFICDISEQTNIALIVNGGLPPYIYLWTNGSINDTLINVGFGTHTVDVTDSDGCNANSTFVVDTFPEINLSFVTSLTGCDGESDGTINLTVSGGLTPFVYEWSNDSITEDLIDLAQGTYTITVTDANNCSVVSSVDINVDPGIQVTESFSNINCLDLDDGSIYLDIIGESSDYDILWNTASDSNYIFDLPPGSYSVTITNINGCTWIQSYVLSLNSDLSITAEVTDNPCFQGQDGSINMQIDNSNSPYNILWNNGSAGEDLSNISAGMYEFSLIDSFGCEYNYFYDVEEGLEMIYSTNVPEPGCNGVFVDSIRITPLAGSMPFSYLWSNGDTTNLISNIQAGYHYLTITDNEGCIKLDTFLILENTILEVNENIVHNLCYGDNQGQISLEISGGLEPYEVLWSNAATTPIVSSLSAGGYSVTVTDAIGCPIYQQVTVTQPDSLGVISEMELPLCFDDIGSISIQGFGGIEPYSILWSTGAVLSTISIEPGNNYEVTITDVNNCSATLDFIIEDILEIDIIVLSVSQSGSSNDNGEVIIDVSGGTSPYQIVWGDGQVGPVASGLGYGSITVNVVDANGCTSQLSIIIDYDPLIIQNTLADNLCFGECKGTVVLEISDGILPYMITWSDGQITPTATNLCNGIYQATIVDATGTEVITEEFEILSPSQINIDGQVFDISCVGIDDGQIGVNASGGSQPFEFSWNNGMNSQDINSLSPGAYQVTVIDENDCINSSNFTLEDIPLIDFEIGVIDFNCDEAFTSIEVIGDNIYNYPIYLNDVVTNLDVNNHIINLDPGNYSLSYQINENCIIHIEEIEIVNPNETQINLNIESAELRYGDLLELTLDITSDLPLSGFFIDWELINYYECTETLLEGQCKTIVIIASENEAVEVTFTDDRGCIKTLTVEIRVDKTVDIFIPNVFSPNGDGTNDNFTITSNYLDISVNRFLIFDRWGNNVFSQQNVILSELLPWNGFFGGKEASEGVYVYLLELTTKEGEQIIKAGDITLIK